MVATGSYCTTAVLQQQASRGARALHTSRCKMKLLQHPEQCDPAGPCPAAQLPHLLTGGLLEGHSAGDTGWPVLS